MALLVLLVGTAGTWIIAPHLVSVPRPLPLLAGHWTGEPPRRGLPTSQHRVGEGPHQEWPNGLGKLMVVLERQVQRDPVDVVHIVEEPPATIDHIEDRARFAAPVWHAGV